MTDIYQNIADIKIGIFSSIEQDSIDIIGLWGGVSRCVDVNDQ